MVLLPADSEPWKSKLAPWFAKGSQLETGAARDRDAPVKPFLTALPHPEQMLVCSVFGS